MPRTQRNERNKLNGRNGVERTQEKYASKYNRRS